MVREVAEHHFSRRTSEIAAQLVAPNWPTASGARYFILQHVTYRDLVGLAVRTEAIGLIEGLDHPVRVSRDIIARDIAVEHHPPVMHGASHMIRIVRRSSAGAGAINSRLFTADQTPRDVRAFHFALANVPKGAVQRRQPAWMRIRFEESGRRCDEARRRTGADRIRVADGVFIVDEAGIGAAPRILFDVILADLFSQSLALLR
jgi:hypothetical protein